MNKIATGAAAILLLAIGIPPAANSQTASLEKCQALKDRIENYTRLRRAGGSAHQMETWKEQLRRCEDRFHEYGCRKYRRKLK
jgi:hypothetical protein